MQVSVDDFESMQCAYLCIVRRNNPQSLVESSAPIHPEGKLHVAAEQLVS